MFFESRGPLYLHWGVFIGCEVFVFAFLQVFYILFEQQEAEMAMLERLPLIGALEAPTLTEQKSLERAARLQELLHFCVNEELRPSGMSEISSIRIS